MDATRTVEIIYEVRNGTRFFDSHDFDGHDEFYWNVTGNDWPVPIDHAAATVRFPIPAAGRCARRHLPEFTDRRSATRGHSRRRRGAFETNESSAHARRADH